MRSLSLNDFYCNCPSLHKTRVCFSTPSLLHAFSGCKRHVGHQGDHELLKWNRQGIDIDEVILEKQIFDSKDKRRVSLNPFIFISNKRRLFSQRVSLLLKKRPDMSSEDYPAHTVMR
jgi:hypothetical protein